VKYLVVDDFPSGLDLRKDALTSPAGTFRRLNNGFVTAGGQIEKRKALTALGTLPAGNTKGVAFVNGALTVFGTLAPGSVGSLPSNVSYAQLSPSGGVTIDRVIDVAVFGTGVYVIARMSDTSIRHFWNGAQLTIAGLSVLATSARAHKRKMYLTDGRNLRFSAVNTPNDYTTTANGAGLIDVTTEDAGSADLVGLEQYYSTLALMGRNSIQIWAMDPDPAQNSIVQVLGNIGLVAPNAVSRYGNGDVLFLSDTGIRSLRARDSSNAAVLNDIGSPIDAAINAKRSVLTTTDAERINAFVDPLTGQLWFVWNNEVHVLAQYPNNKVTAWSTFVLPFTPEYSLVANSRIVFRVGEQLFIYGSVPPSGSPFDPNTPIGTSAALYDATPVELITPFISAQQPATRKKWAGLDLSAFGTWEVYANPEPRSPDAWTKIATITDPTYDDGRIPIDMESTHMALRFVSVGSVKHTLAGYVLHYDDGSKD
jgi:hypothetical protein